MKNSMFYVKKIDDNLRNKEKYNDDYLEYILASHIYYNYLDKGMTYTDIINFIETKFDIQLIKKNKLKSFLVLEFDVNNKIYLTIKQKIAIERLEIFIKKIKKYKDYNINELYYLIKEKSFNINYIDDLAINFSLKRLNDPSYKYNDFNEYFYKFLKSYDFEFLNTLVDEELMNIHKDFEFLEIKYLINDESILSVLSLMKVYSIFDFKNINKNLLFSLISIDIYSWINTCEKLKNSLKICIKSITDELKELLPGNKFDILKNRYHYLNRLTLEEIGKKYNVTRERIRQIQVRESKKIKNYFLSNPFHKIYFDTMYNLLVNKKDFLYQEDIIAYFDDEDLILTVFLRLELLDLKTIYSFQYKIVYLKDKLEELIDKEISKLGAVTTLQEHSKLFEKVLVDEFYRKVENDTYVIKNVNKSVVHLIIIKDNFPDGYRPGDIEHYNKFVSLFKEKYPELTVPSIRALSGAIDRYEFILIDRGMYKHVDYCLELPDNIFNKIINYINENIPIIHYSNIYDNFKEELLELGIDNHNYLKGLIDYRGLPDNYVTTRDFITNDSDLSSVSAVIDVIESYDGKFSIDDIKDKLPAIPSHVIKSVLYLEFKNRLISLTSKEYIHLNKIIVSDEIKLELKNLIENTFIELNSEVISVDKIYAKLSLFYPNILKELQYIDSSFGLYSLLEYILPEYYYNRPLLSNNEYINMTNMGVIREYVYTLDKFNIQMVRDFANKMQIGGLTSVIDFMNSISHDYVLVNIDTMVKKDNLNIKDEVINQLKKILSLILKEHKQIDTNTFKGYVMFPSITLPWNKYLLVGIVKTYLSEWFEVVNTENRYLETDYIIKEVIEC